MKTHESLSKKLLKHFKKHLSITSLEFANKYNSVRLSRYVELLRKEGHNIETVEIEPKKKYKYVYNF